MELARPSGVVTLTTDFGTADPYVGVMKGMVLRAHPRASLVDLCHQVPPQAVPVAAWMLAAAVDRFPAGTVHVAVVDPGVGTGRRSLAVYAHDCYWVGPDNGVFTALFAAGGRWQARCLEVEQFGIPHLSRTFHGRDLYAPVAGWLAGARYGFHSMGPRLQDPVRCAALTDGPPRVIHVDHYGNLVTNLAAGAGPCRQVSIAGRTVPVLGTYGEVEPGCLLALVNSYGLLEVALRDGSAARTLGVGVGTPVQPMEHTP